MSLNILLKEAPIKQCRVIFFAALLSGLSNTGVLIVSNNTSLTHSPSKISYVGLSVFLLLVIGNIIGLQTIYKNAAMIFETSMERLTNNLLSTLRKAPLLTVERVGQGQILNCLTQDFATLTQSVEPLVGAVVAIIIVPLCYLYMAYFSIWAFFLSAATMIIGIMLYLIRKDEIQIYRNKSTRVEISYFETVSQFLNGFKQVKINERLATKLLNDLEKTSTRSKLEKLKVADLYHTNMHTGRCFIFLNLAVLVFFLPKFVPITTNELTALCAAALFSLGSLTSLVGAIPAFLQADAAIKNVLDLQKQLTPPETTASQPLVKSLPTPKSIVLKDLGFTFPESPNQTPFSVGPFNLEIKAGEVTLIHGGNGCGKSTFLKLLTGLYPADTGDILLNGLPVTSLLNYQELFSAIFSDFYLFEKLYGIPNTDPDTCNELLSRLDLTGLSLFDGERFINLAVSTGQRKRIAMMVALLEDRPIYIFDEWAADQDPEHRKYFYETCLKELKDKGKTVIAVTHDDAYFHVADRLIKMSYGQIESIQENLGL